MDQRPEPDQRPDFKTDIELIGRIRAVPTLLDVVCLTTGMRFAAVARVTEDRWIACRVRDDINFGLRPGGELPVETTICDAIRKTQTAVIIENVADDPRYVRHDTPKMYGFQSYISVPVVLPDGTFFGTLCAIDPLPARIHTPQIVGMFEKFAELIGYYYEAELQLRMKDEQILDEGRTAQLREQFIAVLGHDLRNPLAGVAAGIRLIGNTPLDRKAQGIVPLVQASVARMAALIDNIMDFARGRLGDGLTLARQKADLNAVIAPLVDELLAAHEGRTIERDLRLPKPVDCDPVRIAQLVSNLLANALTYGAADGPVRLRATEQGGRLELSVSNTGDPIPPSLLAHLFEPFERGTVRPSQQGLGLGLYIAYQIARAHGGKLAVASCAEETRFTFTMPTG